MSKRRIILVGGGLANGLIAYRLAGQRPEAEIVVVESDVLGGNHTWCFHATDLTPAQQAWMAPFVVRQWDGYDVRFPNRSRRLALRYCCVTAERLRETVGPALRQPVIAARATALDARTATLEDGSVLEGDLVLDGRGGGDMSGWAVAWQAFFGLQLRLDRPHGVTAPVIMDSTVSQSNSYRFFYSLPFSEDTILIEDTRYQNDRPIDRDSMRAEIEDYASSRGWRIAAVEREESGALPLLLSGRPKLPRAGAVPVGIRAGLFHPVTGYSLPDAVRIADLLAAQQELTTEAVRPAIVAAIRQRWRRHGFYQLLNRMLFMAGAPEARWRILSRFYSLPEPLVARFYAGTTTPFDIARILTGRPPVAMGSALLCVPPSSARGFIGGVAEA